VSLPPFLTSIVNWLRAGYPNGVPSSDYVPLVALLARRLTADEVRQVADELIASGTLPASKVDIGVPITKITDELPREEDILRIREKLALAGWPVSD
jgi:Protein of unknown function (DUF3349)